MVLTKEFLLDRITAFRSQAEQSKIDSERWAAAAEWTGELIKLLDSPEPEVPVVEAKSQVQ